MASKDYWAKGVQLLKGGPVRVEGPVIKGFQRGREIGIKTANLSEKSLRGISMDEGVYVGFATVAPNDASLPESGAIEGPFKNMISVGKNPHFRNEQVSIESHLLHEFAEDFYDSHLRVVIIGFIRAQYAFDSLDSLMTAIHKDIEIGARALDVAPFSDYKSDPFLKASPPADIIVTSDSTIADTAGDGTDSVSLSKTAGKL